MSFEIRIARGALGVVGCPRGKNRRGEESSNYIKIN